MNYELRFVDTGYFIALVSRRDQLHARAVVLSTRLRGPLVTTDAVLLEVGNSLARTSTRRLATLLLGSLRSNPDLEIVPLHPSLLAQAIDLYASRLDKEWGLTDCVSFIVMQERDIHEALAADQHFAQAGFRTLLGD